MTPLLRDFFQRSVAAEREGDAHEALEYHLGIPMFRESRHRAVLEQVVAAQDELTPWIWARWIIYQALRSEDPGTRTAALVRASLHDAVHVFHANLMSAAYDEGGDPVQVLATVIGESWACRQLAHEYAVPASFLEELAGKGLLRHADLARSWVDAHVGGYRIERGASPATLLAHDLATSEIVEVLDLGALPPTVAEQWVLGRLVPSGTSPGHMFDLTPLPVERALARQVARRRDPAAWLEVLGRAVKRGRVVESQLLSEDFELMTDVPSWSLVELVTKPTDLGRLRLEAAGGRDIVGRSAFRVLRGAADGSLDERAAAYVAAAVLNPRAHLEAQRKILAAGQAQHWLRWAERAHDPARSRLLRFVELTADAA